MAVSEGQSALLSWKSSFATAIRKDENACQDIFQNSEKLLASAVSICRLKGSVECQTGGLITVCEELQSLIRLAFSGEYSLVVLRHTHRLSLLAKNLSICSLHSLDFVK